MAKKLEHPNIVQYKYVVKEKIEKYDSQVDRYHIVMELLHGDDLATYIKKQYRQYKEIELYKIQNIGR